MSSSFLCAESFSDLFLATKTPSAAGKVDPRTGMQFPHCEVVVSRRFSPVELEAQRLLSFCTPGRRRDAFRWYLEEINCNSYFL